MMFNEQSLHLCQSSRLTQQDPFEVEVEQRGEAFVGKEGGVQSR